MRWRTSRETLAPGVNARDTAERETPARLATSAAVTKARRAASCLTTLPFCTRVQKIIARLCTRVQVVSSPDCHHCRRSQLSRVATHASGDLRRRAENGSAPAAQAG